MNIYLFFKSAVFFLTYVFVFDLFLFVLQKLWFYRYSHEEVKILAGRKKNNKHNSVKDGCFAITCFVI